jgi:hypothetical protein
VYRPKRPASRWGRECGKNHTNQPRRHIRFKENNTSLGRKTSDIGNISCIDKNKMTATFADEKQQTLSLSDPNTRQFSHAYAET